MKKRLLMLSTTVALALAMLMPAGATATTFGKITNTSWSCKNGGNKVVANFKLTKYAGFHATKLIMDAYGQGYYGGGWRSDYYIGRWYANINTNGSAYMTQGFYYIDNQSGSSRILVKAKIMNGSTLVGKGSAHSGFCG